MKIFFDIGHPAHVHYFKNTIINLKLNGHECFITARDKDVTHHLLNDYKIPYVSRGSGRSSFLGKFLYLFDANYRLYKLGKKFKPDLFLSFASPYAGQVAFLLGTPHIAFTDTEHAKLGILAFLPFCDLVVTPKSFKNNLGSKHLKFDGYMEQCYLHKDYFTPDVNVLKTVNLERNAKFIVVRLVSWEASHDIGQEGIKIKSLLKLIKVVEKHTSVFVSSESELPKELQKYQLSINPTELHDLLYFATLFIGEGATMASECAVLGTPCIYINTLNTGYLEEQQSNGLIHIFNSEVGVEEKALEIISDNQNQKKWEQNSTNFLNSKIDVNKFIMELILGYPKIVKKLKENL